MRITWTTCQLAVAALLVLCGSAAAETDPPGRVGRLSFISGTVSLHTADQTEWSPAPLNYPVTSGTSFWTEPDSRAELQVGADEIRMDGSTEVTVVRLDDDATRIEVPQGVVNIHLRTLPPGGVLVTTPLGEVNLARVGSYHIDAGHPNGDTPPDRIQVAVLEGQAQFRGERTTVQVMAGESARIGGNPMTMSIVEANATPFDDWALARERREAASETTHYVSPEMTGYTDLDTYGQWRPEPTYGHLWYPAAVPVGWAPYRYGHWAFVAPWGWTWIDDAPWGFAPFHYGRWVFVGGRWGWWPGAVIVARPVYAPALVAFFGGANWGVSLAVGGPVGAVGWVPLAPHEVFRPYYRSSVTYVRNINITTVNRTVINDIHVTHVDTVAVSKFANRRAVTVVPSRAFVGAAPVDRATVALPEDEVGRSRTMAEVGHLKPTVASRAGVAVSASATAVVPGPNTPGRVAERPITRETPGGAEVRGPGPRGTAVTTAEPTVPRSPGPAVHPRNTASPGTTASPRTTRTEPQGRTTTTERGQVSHGSGPASGPAIVRGEPSREPTGPTVQHPHQTTRITPTPHGWVRAEPQQGGKHDTGHGAFGSGSGSTPGPDTGGRGGRDQGGQTGRDPGGQPGRGPYDGRR